MLRHMISLPILASLLISFTVSASSSEEDDQTDGVLAFSAPVESKRGWEASPRPSPFRDIDFVSFDHKNWTPKSLGAQVQKILHSWLRTANEPGDVKQQYKYLLSAACLGHQRSIIIVGAFLHSDKSMLMSHISDLPCTASKWKLTRLNCPISKNPKVVLLLEQFHGIINKTFDPFMSLQEAEIVRQKLKALLPHKTTEDNDIQMLRARIEDELRIYDFNRDEKKKSAVREFTEKTSQISTLSRLCKLQSIKSYDERLKEAKELVADCLNGYILGEVCQVLRQSVSPKQSNYFAVLGDIQNWALMGALLGDARSMNEFWIVSERLGDHEKAPILAFLEQYLELVKTKGN